MQLAWLFEVCHLPIEASIVHIEGAIGVHWWYVLALRPGLTARVLHATNGADRATRRGRGLMVFAVGLVL